MQLLAVVLTVLTFCLSSAAAKAITSDQAIAYLNEQRAANGIPSVANNTNYASAWCPDEDHGPSGGELWRNASGRDGSAWSFTSSPWDIVDWTGYRNGAPLHEQSFYDPRITVAGFAESEGTSCLGVGTLASPPSVPTFYSVASPAGPSGVSPAEIVNWEIPFAPQQTVGIPQATSTGPAVTGPQILLYAEGFPNEGPFYFSEEDDVLPVSWTLTVAGGAPVEDVRMADDQTVGAYGYPGWMYGIGLMIPAQELAPNTTYHGHVLWQGYAGAQATQDFSFSTGDAPSGQSLTTCCAAGGGEGNSYRNEPDKRGRIRPHWRLRRLSNRLLIIPQSVLVGQRVDVLVARYQRRCFSVSSHRRGEKVVHCRRHRLGKPKSRAIVLHARTQVVLPRLSNGQWLTLLLRVRPFSLRNQRFDGIRSRATVRSRR